MRAAQSEVCVHPQGMLCVQRLDLSILKVFSNLNVSVILESAGAALQAAGQAVSACPGGAEQGGGKGGL